MVTEQRITNEEVQQALDIIDKSAALATFFFSLGVKDVALEYMEHAAKGVMLLNALCTKEQHDVVEAHLKAELDRVTAECEAEDESDPSDVIEGTCTNLFDNDEEDFEG